MNPGAGWYMDYFGFCYTGMARLGLMFVRPNDEEKYSDREDEKNESG